MLSAATASLAAGAGIILPDPFIFGSFADVILDSYQTKPTPNYIIASLTYGGVIEGGDAASAFYLTAGLVPAVFC